MEPADLKLVKSYFQLNMWDLNPSIKCGQLLFFFKGDSFNFSEVNIL